MALDLWTSADLIALMQDNRRDPVPSHFLDTYFTETHHSEHEEIIFAELPAAGRYLAPFVLPNEQGKPIFKMQGEKIRAVKPPYIKPKDAVRPVDVITKRASDLLRDTDSSYQARFDRRVVDIQQFHVRAIRMREAWMAARAFIDARVPIRYERDQGTPSPDVMLDFQRDPGHTITLSGNYWSSPTYDILGDIERWGDLMYAKANGGFPTRVYVGREVAKVFRTNEGILKQLDTTYRGGEDVSIARGIMQRETPIHRLGSIGQGIEVVMYSDQVQNDDGTMVDLLGPKDVLLVAPGATGIRAYGAIHDADAFDGGNIVAEIFPKMWRQPDPSVTFLMHQSAPLPIPMYPNRTLKATVLA